MKDSYKDYYAPYFGDTCREVLADHLGGIGFRVAADNRPFRFSFCSQTVYLTCSYWPEEIPRYHLDSVTGFNGHVPGATDATTLSWIPWWFVVPDESSLHADGLWCFGSEGELRTVLKRLREEVIDVYFRPLWASPSRLAALCEAFTANRRADYEASGVAELRRKAERSYFAKDYRLSLSYYEQIVEGRLTPLERKRVSYMRKHN